jgi:phosphate transport system protein
MTRQYQKEIDKVKKMILQLTAMVEETLQASVKATIERNTELARRVITADEEIDQFEVEIEEECLKLLALYQPVAIDLRYVVAVLKINNDLERIGDLAVNIAKRALDIFQSGEAVEVPFDLNAMLSRTLRMVKRSSDSLVNLDTELARDVREADDEIDRLHRMAFEVTQEQIREHPEGVESYISYLGMSRNLERIADHATNIAEDVIYMVEGEIVRHQGAENDEESHSARPSNR